MSSLRRSGFRAFTNRELRFIHDLNNARIRKDIIRHPTADDIAHIRNLMANLCRGNFKFNRSQKKKLQKYKRIIRQLADPKEKNIKKKIGQSGAAIGAFIPLLVSLLSAVGGKLLNKALPT